MSDKPHVVADLPLAEAVLELLADRVELLPWEVIDSGGGESATGLYTYGHLPVDDSVLDRLPGLKVISNYGVGVDHIDLEAAARRNLPVGNTPDILNGATADMGFALLLAAARRITEGDRYAKGPEVISYDPGCMLGVEVHGQTLGIVGLGRIGEQVARRAIGFGMQVLYHNRRRRDDLAGQLSVRYASLEELLDESDFVMLCTPLTEETRGLIGAEELRRMKNTAVLVNIARGGVVDTNALTDALRTGEIYAAGLDVTEPEPLPRDHPLLGMTNATIVPHLGSATVQTRRRMAEISVENLLRGLRGESLLCEVRGEQK